MNKPEFILPPLPEWADRTLQGDWRDEIISWAEHAIEADRQRRGEPVSVGLRNLLERCREFIDTTTCPAYPAGADIADDIDAFLTSQPAEPVKEASDDAVAMKAWAAAEAFAATYVGGDRVGLLNAFYRGARWRMAAQPAASAEPNTHIDDDAVDHFAAAMKEKLAQARAKGRHGWHECEPADLSAMLRAHVDKGDPRDVANFCMFLWSLGQPISVAAQPSVLESLWQQAYDKAWSVAHLYHTGAGILYWLESEHKRLAASTPPAAEQTQQDSPTPEEEEAWQRMEAKG